MFDTSEITAALTPMVWFFIGISILFGALLQYGVSRWLIPNRHKSYTWVYALRDHRKLGEPCETDLVLNRDGYSLGFSFKRKCAMWVSYTASKGSIGVDVPRADGFYPDLNIPEPYRLKPQDFKNTGYDKGHLAPSASIDFSRKSNDQTFAMSNVALQHPKLNRQVWKRLESIVRGWTHTKGKLMVINGPVYGLRSRRINDIPLPRFFYKVVYSFKHQTCIGFVLPNKDISANDVWDYAFSVEEVEQQTGLVFFDKLDSDLQQDIKSKKDLKWWREVDE